MSALLKEILDMVALPFKWIDDERAMFSFDDRLFGIFVEYMILGLPNREVTVANVSFGRVRNLKFGVNDIDTSLTNFGKPRTILSTVAEACLANHDLMKSEIISLAAADQAKNKRELVYSLAVSEIRSKVRAFRNDFTVTGKSGSRVMILAQIALTDDEKNIIKDELGLNKV